MPLFGARDPTGTPGHVERAVCPLLLPSRTRDPAHASGGDASSGSRLTELVPARIDQPECWRRRSRRFPKSANNLGTETCGPPLQAVDRDVEAPRGITADQ